MRTVWSRVSHSRYLLLAGALILGLFSCRGGDDSASAPQFVPYDPWKYLSIREAEVLSEFNRTYEFSTAQLEQAFPPGSYQCQSPDGIRAECRATIPIGATWREERQVGGPPDILYDFKFPDGTPCQEVLLRSVLSFELLILVKLRTGSGLQDTADIAQCISSALQAQPFEPFSYRFTVMDREAIANPYFSETKLGASPVAKFIELEFTFDTAAFQQYSKCEAVESCAPDTTYCSGEEGKFGCEVIPAHCTSQVGCDMPWPDKLQLLVGGDGPIYRDANYNFTHGTLASVPSVGGWAGVSFGVGLSTVRARATIKTPPKGAPGYLRPSAKELIDALGLKSGTKGYVHGIVSNDALP
jgi:hypothetical protein